MSVRKFRMRNSDGREFDLMRRDAFFHDPSGLGFSRSADYQETGLDWLESDCILDQKTIDGQMVFQGYRQYTEFKQFIAKAPLILCYTPLDTEYRIKGRVSQLDKGELAEDSRRLICDVTFTASGTWYQEKIYQTVPAGAGTAKAYSFHYPFRYQADRNLLEIWNTGDLPGYIKITMMGPLENPSWSLISAGETVAVGKLHNSIPAGDRLVINSSPAELELALYGADGNRKANLYQDADFDTERFFQIPIGKSYIRVGDDGGGVVQTALEVRANAETV